MGQLTFHVCVVHAVATIMIALTYTCMVALHATIGSMFFFSLLVAAQRIGTAVM